MPQLQVYLNDASYKWLLDNANTSMTSGQLAASIISNHIGEKQAKKKPGKRD